MKYRFVLTGMVLAGTTSATALAMEDSGVDLGVRLGYGIPLGEAAENADLNDLVTGQVPIWIDAGYRITPNWVVGLYFQYGFAFLADNVCPSGTDCSAHAIRVGLQGQYRFMPREKVNPWLGLGIGYEWLGGSVSIPSPVGSVDVSLDAHGFEFVNFQGGADFQVGDGIGIGPFLSFSLGEYSRGSFDVTGPATASGSDDIENQALHEWLTLGVRGAFDL